MSQAPSQLAPSKILVRTAAAKIIETPNCGGQAVRIDPEFGTQCVRILSPRDPFWNVGSCGTTGEGIGGGIVSIEDQVTGQIRIAVCRRIKMAQHWHHSLEI